MPDLNLKNEKLQAELVDAAKFWIDKGVDGFRLDAAKYLYLNDTNATEGFWKWSSLI